MAHKSALIAEDIEKYLQAHQHKSLLRFMTCGSVDDGKSTLIGRLLYESKLIFADHLSTLHADSRKANPGGAGGEEELNLALLMDGLAAEREQGITIDVAYRFFSTERRKFIVADTPGHEQYTRNMVTAASTTDLAIILVDARKGILTQTRRHSYLVALLGIRQVVLAVNKMDVMDFSQQVFDAIVAEYRQFAQKVGITEVTAIPLSALRGDNVTTPSQHTSWYRGPALMPYLEAVELSEDLTQRPFRLPVQWVNRPNQDFRGFTGLITAGSIARGARLRVLPAGRESTVTRIVTHDGDLQRAVAGQAVTLTLADEIDISRGDVLSELENPAAVADQFQATLIWMHEDGMLPGRPYLFKLGTQTAVATVTALRHKVNVNTLEQLAAKKLELNEIGVCNLALDRMIAFDPYRESRDLGGFILIDRITNDTVGAGLISFALRRADNIHWQALDITKAARATLKGQRPCVLWFTGLSGTGKSTIANLVEKRLYALGRHTYVLDGDNVRHGLNKDLGFTTADRVQNIRRIGEVAKLMVDAGLIVLVSSISPFRAERRMVRDMLGSGEFFEIFIDTPLAVAEKRDPKGLYKNARAGKLKNFTGIDSPYESPKNPDLRIDTTTTTAERAAELIVAKLQDSGHLSALAGAAEPE